MTNDDRNLFIGERAKLEEEAERREREAQLAAIEEHKRLEAENQERFQLRNKTYQRDLDMQIDYQKRTKEKEKEEEVREFLLGKVRNPATILQLTIICYRLYIRMVAAKKRLG